MSDSSAVGRDPQAEWHEMLLRLAGRVPDEVTSTVREDLVAGRLGEVAEEVCATVLDHGVALLPVDIDLLDEALPADPRIRAIRRGVADLQLVSYGFVPLAPGAAWSGTPIVLDLTTVHRDLAAVAADDLDAVAVRAAGAEAGSVALWRAFRLPPPGDLTGPATRVYLLEADRPAGELPAVTVRMQRVLAEVGLAHPQVEVYRPGADLPLYQRRARGHAALLWTATPGEPVEIARVFDRAHPATGPQFDPEHERLTDPGERGRVLDYLRAGEPLLVTTAREPDFLDPDRRVVVPASFRTDGHWIWTDAVAYYLEEYFLAPDVGLLASIRRAGYRMPTVDAVARHRALAALQ